MGTTQASHSMRPQGLVSLRGQFRQTVSPQLPWGSLEKAKASISPKRISCKSMNCFIWGATHVFQRMSCCVVGCAFVNSVPGNGTCSVPRVSVCEPIMGNLIQRQGHKATVSTQQELASMLHRAALCLKKKRRQVEEPGWGRLENFLTEKSKYTWRIYFRF